MKVYRIAKCKYIDDLSGSGSASYSGRWHSKGTYIVYAASSASLALLETVVHIAGIIIPEFCLICLEIPDKKIAVQDSKGFPSNWNANPSPDILKQVGDRLIKDNKHLALKIPSAVIPEEDNYFINPNHPEFKNISVVYRRKISIDEAY